MEGLVPAISNFVCFIQGWWQYHSVDGETEMSEQTTESGDWKTQDPTQG